MSTFVSKRNLARQTFCCYRDVLWQRRSVKGTMLLLPGTWYQYLVPGTWCTWYQVLLPGISQLCPNVPKPKYWSAMHDVRK